MDRGGDGLGQVRVGGDAGESPIVVVPCEGRECEGVLHGVLYGVSRVGVVCHHVLLEPHDPRWRPGCGRTRTWVSDEERVLECVYDWFNLHVGVVRPAFPGVRSRKRNVTYERQREKNIECGSWGPWSYT